MTLPSPTSSRPWRLGIVDDDEAVLRSLGRMLAACGYEVSTFPSADAFLAGLKDNEPDALLLDLRMPGIDGLSLVDQLRERGYSLPTVFLSGHADVPTSVRAIRGGALDFLEKPCDEATLLASLARALDVAQQRRSKGDVEELRERWRSLTPRERQVCRHVVQGRLNKQIAASLGTREKTVKVHRGRGMSKMRVGSVAELVRLLDRLGEGAD
jgi:FixJ family two-component response regulator